MLRAILPRLTQPGIVTEAELDPETIGVRLAEERRRANATLLWELVFGAWGRTPE